MHLTGIKLGGIPPFTEPIRLRFDERVNVFIGPNASGKSTLLAMLADFFQVLYRNTNRPLPRDRSLSPDWCDDFPETEFDEPFEWNQSMEGASENILGLNEDWPSVEDFIPDFGPNTPLVVHLGAVRREFPDITVRPLPGEHGDAASEMLNGPFSAYRTMLSYKLLGDEFLSRGPNRLTRELINHGLEGVRDWVLGDPDARQALEPWFELRKAAELANGCSKQICDEILLDSELHNYIHEGTQENNDPTLTILPLMGVNTVDIREVPAFTGFDLTGDSHSIYLGHLSSGTAGILLWIRWLSLKIAYHYNFETDWNERPAILLIDEIENHLHPTWQRRVIPALLEYFPNLQIFATTHSPFVVAGLKAGQVHVLKRDENGVVTATTEPRDVVGWTADEILRGMMEVDEPTDQLTVDRANRLRALRDKENLTGAEEDELNQLRRQVNNDLLSRGGLLEEQRQRYADLVQDFLQTRQSELTQEGE